MRRVLKCRIAVFFLALMMAATVLPAVPGMTVTVEAAQAKAVKNGWKKVSGKWYYYKSGKKKKGWIKVKNKWYYLHKSSGVMQTGWKKVNGKWYYMDKKSGVMQTGWIKVSGKWYYLDPANGAMLTGWLQDAGKSYYLNASGAMLTGLQTIDGKQYYLGTGGRVHTDLWQVVNGKLRYFGADGVMAADTSVMIEESECKFDANGDLTNRDELPEAMQTKLDALIAAAAKPAATTTTATTSSSKTKGKYTAEFVMKNCPGITGKRAQFVADIANAVTKYAPSYGIKVYSPIIAQAIHESAWGESTLGAKYHNYFGLKCGTTWTGKSVNVKTTEEYTVGKITVIKDNFRVYDNLDVGVKGYFEFIQKDRYANLKGVTSCKKYLENIKADGYATGSQYVTNTMRVVTTYNLTIFDPK